MGVMSCHVKHVTRQQMTQGRVLHPHPQTLLPAAYFEWKEGLEVVMHFSGVGAAPPVAG